MEFQAMPKISDQVIEIIANEETKFDSTPEYRKFKDFLDRAKEAGLITKRTYSIPPTDTIGKKFREAIKIRVEK